MVLRLRAESGRHQHLWLAADSMEEANGVSCVGYRYSSR